jgi:hypothetical protein
VTAPDRPDDRSDRDAAVTLRSHYLACEWDEGSAWCAAYERRHLPHDTKIAEAP